MHKSTTRFSDRVANYIKYRPGYPLALLNFFKNEIGLTANSVIADIGSGTGISSKMFLDNGNEVFGVEPNREMREAAENLLADYPNFRSINASAEDTLLLENSIDLVLAGQAFHWFDAKAFRIECKRILKANAYCALLWNERLENTAFLKEYEIFILKYATDYESINHKNISRELIDAFYFPNKCEVMTFENEQIFDFEGLRGRLESSSYIPTSAASNYDEMIDELAILFNTHQVNNEVIIHYETKLYYGQL